MKLNGIKQLINVICLGCRKTIVIFLLFCFTLNTYAQSKLTQLAEIEQKIHQDSGAALDDLYALESTIMTASRQEKLQWLILSFYSANMQDNRQAILNLINKSQILLNKSDPTENLWLQLFSLFSNAIHGDISNFLKELQQLDKAIAKQQNPLLSAYFNRQLHFAYAMNGAIDFSLETALSNYQEWLQLEQYYFAAEMLYRIAELRSTMGDYNGARIALVKASSEAKRLSATNMQVAIIELEAQMMQDQSQPQKAYDKLNILLSDLNISPSHDRYESIIEKMASYSFELKQFAQTITLSKLLLTKQIKENKNTEFSELLLAKAYIQSSEFDKARPLIDKLMKTFTQQGNRYALFEIKNAQLDMLHREDDINGLFQSAKSIIELVTTRVNNNLDIQRSQRSNTLVQAKAQEKNVERLEKSNEIQREELSINKELIAAKNRNIILLSVFCTLLVGLFIWLFYLLKKVRKLANTDSLTGINNRRAGLIKAAEFLRKSNINSENNHLVFAMLDLDNFKKINDTYGHDVGDQVIKLTVNKALKLLDKNDFICRMGGEEFLIGLSNKSEQTVIAQIEKIRRDIHHSETKSLGLAGQISASIGIVHLRGSQQEKSLTEYLIDADIALYNAKNNGRNQIQVFEQGLT